VKVNDRRDVVYLAVSTENVCGRATKDKVAFGDGTLYFVHWVGNPGGGDLCKEGAMGLPFYRLFVVPLAQLPPAGTLSVQLVVQVQATGTTVAATSKVELG
jgi:hypothetical protein